MSNYPSFQGKKFRPTGELTSYLDNCTNERIYKEDFMPTKSYSNYLEQKYLKELELECKALKHKLDAQLRNYGEIDSIDLGEYNYKLNMYYKQLAIATK